MVQNTDVERQGAVFYAAFTRFYALFVTFTRFRYSLSPIQQTGTPRS